MSELSLKRRSGHGPGVKVSHGRSVSPIVPHHRGETVVSTLKAKHVDKHLVSLTNPTSMEAERYRRLRHTVEELCHSDQGIVIGISSPVAGEGKTLTSINLAGALAQDPHARVLLVELDLRQPFTNVKEYLGLRRIPGPGLVDKVLNSNIVWEKAVRYLPAFNLYYMPSGKATTSPYELLKSPQIGRVLEEARQLYDYVILDTPPVALLPDSQLIARCVNGFLMVVSADSTPRQMLADALNYMEPDKVLGLVFNGYSPVNDPYSYYEYAYSRLRRPYTVYGRLLSWFMSRFKSTRRS